MEALPFVLEDLLAFHDISDPQAGPSSQIAFRCTRSDAEADRSTGTIWLADGDAVSQLTDGPDDRAPRWQGNDLLFVRPVDDVPQLHRRQADGTLVQLTDLPGGVREFAVSPDQVSIVVLSGPASGGSEPSAAPRVVQSVPFKSDGGGGLVDAPSDILVVGADDEIRLLLSSPHSLGSPCWRPDGAAVAVSTRTSPDTPWTELRIIDVASGAMHRPEHPAEMSLRPIAFAAQDEVLCVAGSVGLTGNSRLVVVGSEATEHRWLFEELDRNIMLGAPGYPGALPWATSNGTVVFAIRDGGHTHLWEGPLDGTQPAKPIVADHHVVVSGACPTRDGSLAWIASDPNGPGALWRRPAHGPDIRLTNFDEELLASRRTFQPEPLAITAPDGITIHGWVRDGATGGPAPLLVDIHGGPHNAWTPSFEASRLYHQVLASQGWLILTLNIRGSDGYGESFHRGLVERGWGHSDEADVLTAIDHLVEAGRVDPARVAVAGYSYGGYLTSWLIARFPERFAAAVAGGVVANRVSHATTADVGLLFVESETGSSYLDAIEELWRSSPSAHLANVRTPTLVLHGERDDRCPVGQAEELFAALHSNGVPTELVVYPGAAHGFIQTGRPSHRVDWQARIVQWLRDHVPHATPDGQ